QSAPGSAGYWPINASTRRALSAREPCIFQFPTTTGRRMERPQPGRARDDSDALPLAQWNAPQRGATVGKSSPHSEVTSGGRGFHYFREFRGGRARVALVAPLDHHADHRFGARGAQNDTALSGHPRL